MQLVDVGYQQSPLDEDGVIQAFDKALNSQLTLEQKLTFCQRKLEFLEDFGSDSNRTQEAFEEYGKLLKTHIAASRKRPAETNDESSVEKKAKSEINGSVPVSTPPAPVNPPAPAPIPVPAPVPTQPVQPAPAPMAPDPSAAYGYHQAWPGAYPQNPYNYQQPWTGYHPSYYPH
ncbi:pre-mRNA-processing factor 39-like [Limulus polyphemus]|uniref:Pre-mRNA-processing factor 39-like n=1 Tax=Limulus polyphemus TaxID=6850 RepID=A0ABM1BX92_LIMPO|nr:pre-mRNA-processing factor 39-like [Limulus polyphemus]XP_022258312.1 pre-mRNA-processing factor 39-like [Limulus polyphemus]XP_022258313.1 pre-mRNA-processing factor 39-like [Limulus polyphemus]